MKLEAGKRYVRRDGKVTGELIDYYEVNYPFCDPHSDETYTLTGSLFNWDEETPEDIVKEYNEEAHTITDEFKWVPGAWYKTRDGDRAMFVGKTVINQLVFSYPSGLVIKRNSDGSCQGKEYKTPIDILPEIWEAPFKPKIGMWRCRDGSEVAVMAFNKTDRYPILGIFTDYSWTETGKFVDTETSHNLDLIEWLRPLDKEYIEWED